MFLSNKKIAVLAILAATIVVTAFTAEEKKKEEGFKNLKVLPKNTTGEQIHQIMVGYSKALGVRCNHCHVVLDTVAHKMDFVSDAKPEKDIARKMFKMEAAINKKYINKIGNKHFEQISCVSCHMGRVKPIITADSLPKYKKVN